MQQLHSCIHCNHPQHQPHISHMITRYTQATLDDIRYWLPFLRHQNHTRVPPDQRGNNITHKPNPHQAGVDGKGWEVRGYRWPRWSLECWCIWRWIRKGWGIGFQGVRRGEAWGGIWGSCAKGMVGWHGESENGLENSLEFFFTKGPFLFYLRSIKRDYLDIHKQPVTIDRRQLTAISKVCDSSKTTGLVGGLEGGTLE